MAVIQAQNAVDRRDREEETGSGQQKQDSCNCSMTDAGQTMSIKLRGCFFRESVIFRVFGQPRPSRHNEEAEALDHQWKGEQSSPIQQ